MRNQQEHIEQVLFFKRVALDPRTRDILIAAVPNGGARHPAVAGKLKAEGVKAGVPDLLIFERAPDGCGGMYCGLAIEMKVKPNKPTPAQESWLAALADRGWQTAVAYSSEEAWAVLCAHLQVTR